MPVRTMLWHRITVIREFFDVVHHAIQRRSGTLTERPMSQSDDYRVILRRAKAAGIFTKIGNHSFRATAINEYLRNAASWKSRNKWRIMTARAQQVCTTGATISLHSTRSSEL